MYRFVFHVGWQKTGSTWLQSAVYPHVSEINYLNENAEFHALLHEQILKQDAFHYENDKAAFTLKKILTQYSKKKVSLISEERLTGDLFYPRPYTPLELSQRVCNLADNPNVIFIIRNQRDLIWSAYKEYLLQGGCCNLNGFLHKEMTSRLLIYLHYSHLIKHYVKLLGRANVYVGLYESLIDDMELFLTNLFSFIFERDVRSLAELELTDKMINKRVHVGFSPHVHGLTRFTNRFTSTKRNPKGLLKSNWHWRIKSLDERLTRIFGSHSKKLEQKEELVDFCKQFVESNMELREFVDLKDCANKGYPIRTDTFDANGMIKPIVV